MPCLVWLGHQYVDLATYDLGFGITENAFGRRVERLDHAAFVDSHDAVDGALDYRSVSCIAFLDAHDQWSGQPNHHHRADRDGQYRSQRAEGHHAQKGATQLAGGHVTDDRQVSASNGGHRYVGGR